MRLQPTVQGAIRREQLSNILFALAAARPEWHCALIAVAVACGLRECAVAMVRMAAPVLVEDVKGAPAER